MLTILLIATIVAGFASMRFAADSRPGFDERPEGERFGVLR